MGCHCLLQGIFLTQGSNPSLLRCKQMPSTWSGVFATLEAQLGLWVQPRLLVSLPKPRKEEPACAWRAVACHTRPPHGDALQPATRILPPPFPLQAAAEGLVVEPYFSPCVLLCSHHGGRGGGHPCPGTPPLAEPPPAAGVSVGGGPRTNQQVLPPKSAASTPSPQDLKPLTGSTSRIPTRPLRPRALRVRLKS